MRCPLFKGPFLNKYTKLGQATSHDICTVDQYALAICMMKAFNSQLQCTVDRSHVYVLNTLIFYKTQYISGHV